MADPAPRLVPPPKHAHLRWHWINSRVLDGGGNEMLEPMHFTGNYWFRLGPRFDSISPEQAGGWGWRYHGPCDPSAITLNPDDPVQVEVAATAVARSQGCVTDDGFWTVKMCAESDECLCRRHAIAVIAALKEMKR
jgi:hypothetical protein